MNNVIKHIFFSLLIIAVGFAISQQNATQWSNVNSSQLDTITHCQQISNGSSSNHSGDIDPLFENDSASNTDDTQPRTITSCNSLVNILPAVNGFSFNPGEQPINVGFHNAVLSSQTFVFQEPDPPRLG